MNYPDPELDLRRSPRSSGWPSSSEKNRHKRRQIMVIAVALGGVILFGAMLWQVYMLGKMTGNEEAAPLIQADGTPTKIRPEQPGGMTIPDQDKVIFDRMNNGQSASVENLLALPEEPMERPAMNGGATPEAPTSETAEAESLFPSPPDSEAMTAPAQETTPAADAEPLAEMAPEPEPPALTPVPTEKVAVINSKPVSEPPPVKPAPTAVKKPKPTTPAPTVKSTVSPAPAGESRIQLAAVSDASAARTAALRLQQQYPNDLGPLPFRINKVEIKDKGTFYRIQAGPLPDSEAKALCEKLKAKNLGCILVK